MRIAILKNDSPPDELRAAFPDYDRMIMEWISPLDSDPHFTVYKMYDREVPDYDHDLYISSGSRRSVYEEEEWISGYREVVLKLHDRKKPHFGICYGHQMIALALGGRVGKASGWGIGIHRWQVVNPAFQEKLGEGLSLCASHQDQVLELTEEMKPFLRSEFCPWAGFSVGRHILSVQGHPEFSPDYLGALMDLRRSRYPEEVYHRGKASLSEPTDEGSLLPLIRSFFFES